VLGNYTVGYPDESFEELMETLMMAKRHMSEGLDVASFFCIVPFPGTTLYDMALKGGHLSRDFDPDTMSWTAPIMANTLVPAETLERIRHVAWKLVNRSEFVAAKEAIGYLVVLYETLGPAWMTADRFRFGASSLLNDLLMQIRKERTGRYSGTDYFTLD
jgi:radical SAM superfamily enzyme YgiQ (UPF0313 family)